MSHSPAAHDTVKELRRCRRVGCADHGATELLAAHERERQAATLAALKTGRTGFVFWDNEREGFRFGASHPWHATSVTRF